MRGALAGVAAALLSAAGLALHPSAAQPAAGAEAFGKPVAPFSLEAEALEPPAVGVPVGVRITVSTRTELEDIEVRISADPGLSVDAANLTLYSRSASPEDPAEWRIEVVPVAEGAHRLRLFGEALVGGARQGRSTVATIRVGAAEAAERESTVQSRPDRALAVRDDARAGDRRKAAPEDESGGRADEAETGAERVIRLPAIERP